MDELDFCKGRRVLVTGHTGFKGAWLTLWLQRLGADVIGYSLGTPTVPALYELLGLAADVRHRDGDIRDAESLTRLVQQERPEVVFHLAAQSLVRRSHAAPRETFDVNVGGTVNVLEAVRTAPGVRVVVIVTSDKCYAGTPPAAGFDETSPLGGCDPYSASKAAAEMAVAAYRASFFGPGSGVGLASARAGNVIGGGDWAEDRIVPDCLRALAADEPVRVRHPAAVRPWQHVLEPLAGYLVLAARLWHEPERYAGAWNFGPAERSMRPVRDLVAEVHRQWGGGTWQRPASVSAMAEAECLRLCSDKARALLAWQPQWDFATTARRTVEWYRAFYGGEGAARLRELCLCQIADHEAAWGRCDSPLDPVVAASRGE